MYPLETSLTGKTGARDTASETLIRVIFPIVIYCGGYSAGAPPLPIPNREVKPGRADGTAPLGGRVGRCRFCMRRLTARDSVSSASSLFIPPPLLLSSVTARPGTPVMVLLHFRCRCRSWTSHLPHFPGISVPGAHCRVHLPQFCCVPAPGVPASAMVAYGLGCCAGYLLSGVMNAGSGKCIPAIVSPFFIA